MIDTDIILYDNKSNLLQKASVNNKIISKKNIDLGTEKKYNNKVK